MDVNGIVRNVMNQLGMTSPVDKKRTEEATNNIINHILGDYKWRFLRVETTLPVSSATSEYDVDDDFLFPVPDSMHYPDGKIFIVDREYLASLYPDLTYLTELKYAIFGNRIITFYDVSNLDSVVTVTYVYHRTGKPNDLDVDPGFVEIIQNGVIKNVAKANMAIRDRAAIDYATQLEKKKLRWEISYGGS